MEDYNLMSQFSLFLARHKNEREKVKNDKIIEQNNNSSDHCNNGSIDMANADPTTLNAFLTHSVVLRRRPKPVKFMPFDGVDLSNYKIKPQDIPYEVYDWVSHYLMLKNCPLEVISEIALKVSKKMEQEIESKLNFENSKNLGQNGSTDVDSPDCAFEFNSYDVAKQSRQVMNELLDKMAHDSSNLNDFIETITDENDGLAFKNYQTSQSAVQNTRPTMEDRHVIISDLNKIMDLKTTKKYSYYAVFDGHAGVDAANYSSAHLHRFLVESPAFYEGKIEDAIYDAFKKTDESYCRRVKKEGIGEMKSAGTTALFALIEDKKTCYFAWVGDSQAVLVKNGVHQEITLPHRPADEDEKLRIQNAGGFCVYVDTWRLNGVLSVSRAIGDLDYKPSICAEPSIARFDIDSSLDFLVLGCDGLFDVLTGQDIAAHVFEFLCQNETSDTVMSDVSAHLSNMAIREGSSDNITSIVVFFKPIEELVSTGLNTSPNNTDLHNTSSTSSSTYFTANNPSGSSLLSNYQPTNEDPMHSMLIDPSTLKNGHFPYTDFAQLPIGTNFNLEKVNQAPSATGSDSAVQMDSSHDEDDDDDEEDEEEKNVPATVEPIEVEDVSSDEEADEFMHYVPGTDLKTEPTPQEVSPIAAPVDVQPSIPLESFEDNHSLSSQDSVVIHNDEEMEQNNQQTNGFMNMSESFNIPEASAVNEHSVQKQQSDNLENDHSTHDIKVDDNHSATQHLIDSSSQPLISESVNFENNLLDIQPKNDNFEIVQEIKIEETNPFACENTESVPEPEQEQISSICKTQTPAVQSQTTHEEFKTVEAMDLQAENFIKPFDESNDQPKESSSIHKEPLVYEISDSHPVETVISDQLLEMNDAFNQLTVSSQNETISNDAPVSIHETPAPVVEASISVVEPPVSVVEPTVSVVEASVSEIETLVSDVEPSAPEFEAPKPETDTNASVFEMPVPIEQEPVLADESPKKSEILPDFYQPTPIKCVESQMEFEESIDQQPENISFDSPVPVEHSEVEFEGALIQEKFINQAPVFEYDSPTQTNQINMETAQSISNPFNCEEHVNEFQEIVSVEEKAQEVIQDEPITELLVENKLSEIVQDIKASPIFADGNLLEINEEQKITNDPIEEKLSEGVEKEQNVNLLVEEPIQEVVEKEIIKDSVEKKHSEVVEKGTNVSAEEKVSEVAQVISKASLASAKVGPVKKSPLVASKAAAKPSVTGVKTTATRAATKPTTTSSTARVPLSSRTTTTTTAAKPSMTVKATPRVSSASAKPTATSKVSGTTTSSSRLATAKPAVTSTVASRTASTATARVAPISTSKVSPSRTALTSRTTGATTAAPRVGTTTTASKPGTVRPTTARTTTVSKSPATATSSARSAVSAPKTTTSSSRLTTTTTRTVPTATSRSSIGTTRGTTTLSSSRTASGATTLTISTTSSSRLTTTSTAKTNAKTTATVPASRLTAARSTTPSTTASSKGVPSRVPGTASSTALKRPPPTSTARPPASSASTSRLLTARSTGAAKPSSTTKPTSAATGAARAVPKKVPSLNKKSPEVPISAPTEQSILSTSEPQSDSTEAVVPLISENDNSEMIQNGVPKMNGHSMNTSMHSKVMGVENSLKEELENATLLLVEESQNEQQQQQQQQIQE